MIAVHLTDQVQAVVVGSPGYFAKHKRPATPQELIAHNCTRMRLANGAMLPWRFEKSGEAFEVPVTGSLILNDVDLVCRAAVDGIALACIPRVYVDEAIAAKHLVPVLDGWMPASTGLSLYYPSRRQTPAALQALIDFFREDGKSRRAGR
jgi:DNA-binding transcriptional LysR family regulator